MEYRPLGNTGLSVSVLGQGGAAFGQQYGAVSPAEVADTVHAAVDAGVNLIDTSAYYGRGVSEELIGKALAGGWRDRVNICTKACRLDRDVFDFTPEGTRKCVEGSLRRLGTDHVEILLAHDIEFATDYEYVFNETYRTLEQLKKEGKTRFIGMSCYPLPLLKQAIERCRLDAVISYAHFNLFNTRLLTELLPVAAARGTGVMNASALAMGLLTNQGPQPWFPGPPEVIAACKRAAELCRARGADIAFLGMQFAYSEKSIPCTLSGAARKGEFDANLRALAEPIDRALLADVMAVLDPVRDRTWPCGNWKG
ncbi:Oxidoreductase OS=Gracilibacillus boraciitolerans JCM 21714 GN=JCM21714_3508 PE=4 SV=1: Aldo_ket_red [Gemmataceae bacterium]|nr:Oxidoreductase OS=Gracilibacillus boraciitolerans JCM 21714 GN=JCM21714_3508 PE=4 SV=1: Aldo_ket_red [Gemmataceae bacterium]VTT97168.1 Oxidoreductase OS=Gracilibacillus boraciitolerans JCM 21714 GN=JCM21714_3508 PE=4 SV=1: Aldo_ket_red [Gemmataceae bacterium]